MSFAASTVFTEGRHTGEYILSEARGLRSRDAATIAAGAGVILPGQVLGRITASQKLTVMKETATDGSNIAVAINYAWVDATSADVSATVTARDTEVFGKRLTWDASVSGTPANLAAAIAELAEIGIIVR